MVNSRQNHYQSHGEIMKHILIFLIFIFSQQVHAATGGWISRDGKPVPNSASMKTINGFGGWLVVTPDADWEAKWNTSPETVPRFSAASEIRYGETVTILTFFINPETNAAGDLQILCDIKVTRPDGNTPIDARDVNCASGKLQGKPHYIRLSSAVIRFVGEDGDPPGKWQVEVNLTDKIRGTTIPLKTHFTLLENKQ